MVFVKDIDIKNYRGINNLSIKGFSDINVIVGDNNCGKTSLLEVLEEVSEPLKIINWTSSWRRREGFINSLTDYEAIDKLFNINNFERKIEVSLTDNKNVQYNVIVKGDEQEEYFSEIELEKLRFGKRMFSKEDLDDEELMRTRLLKTLNLEMQVWGEGLKKQLKKAKIFDYPVKTRRVDRESIQLYKSIYIAPFQHTFNSIYLKEVLEDHDLYMEMLEILKEFDADIININSYVDEYRKSVTYTLTSKDKNKALPLNVYGDGMKKVLLLMSAIAKAKDGVLLIDEFETAIHTSALEHVFKWVIKTCTKLNVQLFITTHSDEAIEKFLYCANNNTDNVRVVTLYKKEEKTVARVLNGKQALDAKSHFGLELRG